MPARRAFLPRLVVLVACLAGCAGRDVPDGRPVIDLLAEGPRAVTESRFLPFGTGERGHLVRGWHRDEWNRELGKHFAWAYGRRATVRLTILQVLDQQVLLELSPVAAAATGPIDVSVNDVPLTTLRPVPGYREYRFVIPARLLRRGSNHLAFDHAVVGDPPRRLAASYSWILLGPACLRLRPTGRPPEPTHVRAADGALEVRGPAELGWTITPPAGARLEVRAAVGEDPVALALEVRDDQGWHPAGEARLSPPWLADTTVRDASFDLGRWSGRPVALRLRVLPEACGSPYAEARFLALSIVADD